MGGLPRTVIVTGGLGGIGLAIAEAFAGAGDRVVLLDQVADAAAAKALCAGGAADALSLACDITKDTQIAAALAQSKDRFGDFDVLVNVAGAMLYKPLAELTADDWHRVLGVNLVGAALLCGAALREMPQGGAIVNIASVHAYRTAPLVATYAAAKAALVSLTRSVAIEGRTRGIRCNAILPGAIDTAILRESPNIKSGAEQLDPADIGAPRDIADAAFFLASDAARFMTGSEITVDGGRMGRL